MVKWIIGAVIGVIVVVFTFLVIDPNVSAIGIGHDYGSSITSVYEEKINVSISGAVIFPGTYTLNKDETLADLIEKAGGVVSSADTTCYDETIKLDGHEGFYIPYIAGFSQECVAIDTPKVNINTASVSELATINGISTSIAEKIVEYRTTNGLFTCLEDIVNVSGIGTKTYEKIRDYICIKD